MTKAKPEKDAKPPTEQQVDEMPRIQQLYVQRHEIELEKHGDDRAKAVKDFKGGSQHMDEPNSPLPKQTHESPPETPEVDGRGNEQSELSELPNVSNR